MGECNYSYSKNGRSLRKGLTEKAKSKQLISDRLYGNEVETEYAQDKVKEIYHDLAYHDTLANRDRLDEWQGEVKRLQEEKASLDKQLASYKTIKQAPDFIKEQVGLDITKFRNSASQQFEKRGQITIDITDMSQADRTRLSNALRQKYSPYTGEQSGTWLFTIKKKPKQNVPF